MTIKVSEETGGPYTHEIDAIRDERHRASIMNIEPDFESVFAGVEFISTGAAQVIADIGKPIVLPVGEFIENVVFDDEEEKAPESSSAEETATGDTAGTESTASTSTISEPGNAEIGTDTSVDTPIYNEVTNV